MVVKKEVKQHTAAVEVKPAVKAEPVKAEEVKKAEPAKKAEPVKKAAPAKKAAARKAPAAKASREVKETVFVQYSGRELKVADLVAAAKKDYEKKTGAKAADIKTIELYVKPEENVAYYVVNGKGQEDYKVEF